jgi:predicted TIM-barrel fold metal-dependent hydrolase
VEILDSQVHVDRVIRGREGASADAMVDATVAAMDAVGVDTVLIAEIGSAERPAYAVSRRAVQRHPERFGYLVALEHTDPGLDRRMAEVRTAPGCLCLRLIPWPQHGDLDRMRAGEFEPLFAAAERHGVPIFVGMPGQAPLIEPYLQRFPRLPIILDHCGVGVAPPPGGDVPPMLAPFVTATLDERLEELEHITNLARYPNLAIKWGHATERLSAEPYPHRDAVQQLRRVIAAFGAERVLWASDWTESQAGHTWARSLHYLLHSDALSEAEKTWVLGRSAREILGWRQAG